MTLAISQPVRSESRSIDGRLALTVTLLFFIVTAILGRLCYIVERFDGDAATFIFMGRLVSEGGRYGHDFVDNKLPGAALLMSGLWRAFGSNWAAYVLIGGACSAMSSLLLARAARRALEASATIPALLFSLVFLNFSFAVYAGFQLETIQVLFTTMAAVAGLEMLRQQSGRDAFVAGLAAGCAAVLCKPTGLAVVGAIFLSQVIYHRRFRLMLAMLVGCAVPSAVLLAHLLASDTLREFPTLWRQVSSYAAHSAWSAADWIKPAMLLVLLGFPISIRKHVFREDCTTQSDCTTGARVFVIAWFILEAVGIALQGRIYAYHCLMLAPPATLLFAMIPRRERLLPLTAALAPIALLSTWGAVRVIKHQDGWPERLAVSAYIASRTEPGDAVWMDDSARLWIETGCQPGSRFATTFLFANSDEAPEEYVKIMLKDFDCRRPKFILLPCDRQQAVREKCQNILELEQSPLRAGAYQEAWEQIFRYVDSHYEYEDRVGSLGVYRRVQ